MTILICILLTFKLNIRLGCVGTGPSFDRLSSLLFPKAIILNYKLGRGWGTICTQNAGIVDKSSKKSWQGAEPSPPLSGNARILGAFGAPSPPLVKEVLPPGPYKRKKSQMGVRDLLNFVFYQSSKCFKPVKQPQFFHDI